LAFAEDLEAVADTDHGPAFVGELPYCVHHRGEACDGATAEVIAVGEPTGEHDGVEPAEVGFAVPDDVGLLAEDVAKDVLAVAVAPGAGESNDSKAPGSAGSPGLLAVRRAGWCRSENSTAFGCERSEHIR